MTFWLYGTIIAIVIAVVVLQLAFDFRFRHARVTRIADCRDGALVKVVGKAVPIDAETSPLSGRACVAYRISASRGKGKSRRSAFRVPGRLLA